MPLPGGIHDGGYTRIGLLGTRYAMEKEFYRARLKDRHGIESVIPAAADRERINAIIFDELCAGRFRVQLTCPPKTGSTGEFHLQG